MPPTDLSERDPSDSLFTATQQFLDSMEAVRDLALNGAPQVAQLDDKKHAFCREASRQFPHESLPALEECYEIIGKVFENVSATIHEMKDGDNGDDVDSSAIAEAVHGLFDDLYRVLATHVETRDAPAALVSVWTEIDDRTPRLILMQSALLMSAVSNFEVLVGKAMRAIVLSQPGIISRSEKAYTYKDVYVSNAVDTLLVTGELLAVRVLLKLQKPDVQGQHLAFGFGADLSYQLLSLGRFEVVDALASKMMPICKDDNAKLIMQINYWVARKRLAGLDSIKSEVHGWQTVMLESRYKLAKVALLDDHERAADMIEKMISAEEISWLEWTTWPLLQEVRNFVASSPEHASLQISGSQGCTQPESGDADMDR